MKKRILAMVMAVVMAVSLLPVSAFATEAPSQIVNAGSAVFYDKDGTAVDNGTLGQSDTVVEMSKTVAPTDRENEFEVTLQVKTNQKLVEIPATTPDAAVVLVIDVSNSMDDCVNCGKEENDSNHKGTSETKYYCSDESGNTYNQHWHSYSYKWGDGRYDCEYCHKKKREHNAVTETEGGTCAYRSRLADAKDAALDFLTQFATETGATGNDRRMAAVIAFGSDAKTIVTWQDVRTEAGMNEIQGAINNDVKIGNGENKGGTNIEAGLMLAKNVLTAGRGTGGAIQNVDYLHTILLTDGQPTFYVSSQNTTISETEVKGSRGNSGSETEKEDVKDVGTLASAIREMTPLSKLYSICFGNIGSTSVFNTKPFNTWNDADPKTTKDTTVGQWLSAFSNAAYNGQSSEGNGLFDAFDSIADLIAVAAQAWRVTDEMGDDITYLGPVTVSNKDGNGSINNSVTPSEDGKSFVWNILASDYDDNITNIVQNEDGTMESGTLGYTFKYKVRLDNSDAIAKAPVEKVVNSSATLKYMVADDQGNWPDDESALKTGTFAVPQVKGYAADVSFTKIAGDTNMPLEEAEFKLSHKDSCSECSIDSENSVVINDKTASSASETGVVTFENVPSGHEYVLTETKTPGGYDAVDPINVTVAYGNVTTESTEGNTDNIVEGKLVDPKTPPTTGTLKISKAYGEKNQYTGQNDTYTVEITGDASKGYSGVSGASFNEGKATVEVTAGGNAVEITGLPFGVYSISETGATKDGYTLNTTYSKSSVTLDANNASDSVTVTNTYTKAPATLTSDKLNVSKVLSGREWIQGDSFTFILTGGSDGAPMPANSSVTISGTDVSKTKSFGAITFTEVGTYTYTVQETKGTLSGVDGVDYDNSVYTVTVNVSAEEDGALKAVATYQKGNEEYTYGQDGMTFINTYGASSVTISGNDLKVSKKLTGRDWVEDDSFTFTLTGSTGAPMPDATSVNITAADQVKSFGDITFNKAGTYTYTVTENTGTLGGVSYDSSEYVITVTVTDNNQGQLLKSVSYAKKASANARTESITYDSTKGMVFENTYSAQEATITGGTALKVSKDIDGREWNETDSYVFTLAAGTNTAGEGVATPMPTEDGKTVTLTKEMQNGAFGNITFNQAGVYNYTVTENATNIAGVTKDNTVYNVTVTVTDNKAGELVATVAYEHNGTEFDYGENGMTFVNTYSASGTLYGDDKFDGETKTADGQLKVSKTLSGRDWAEGETFTINLTGSEGAPMPAEGGKTVTLTKEKQNGAFGNIEYDEGDIGKTYTYTVTETPGSATGVTYDATQYTVTVKVSVNADDASKLDVTAVHTSSADANKEPPEYSYATAGNMPFTNTYKAGSVIVPGDDGEGVEGKLEINKSFRGRDWADGDVFTFTIAAVTEGAPLPASTSVTIGKPASGSENTAAFGGITFDKADEYKYTVSETKGTLSNVTYDTVVYTVIINVTDDGTGKLKYDVAYSSSKGDFDYAAKDGMVFANTYTKPSKPSTDIPDNPPALNNVDHYAYIIGYPDGNVKPAGNITRAEVATIFFRLLTDESRSLFWSTENAYSDVSADQWFNNAISTLSNAGIINGYEDGTFRPNAPITRAEFAKIAASFFTYAEKEYQGLYPDVPETKWYALFVEAASELGLITGYPDGTFRPDQLITRAEACTIVNRTIERKPHEDQLHQDMILWPDNPAPGEVGHEWYYEQVQEATNSHEYEMKNEYENWTEILENRDWAALEQEWSDANSAPGPDVMK